MPQYPQSISNERAAKLYRVVVEPSTPPSTPVVDPATFALALPVAAFDTVGICTASNSPTSWAIIGGDAAGNFLIVNSGVLTVSAADEANIVAQTYNLTVTASNADGTSPDAAIATNASLARRPRSQF